MIMGIYVVIPKVFLSRKDDHLDLKMNYCWVKNTLTPPTSLRLMMFLVSNLNSAPEIHLHPDIIVTLDSYVSMFLFSSIRGETLINILF